MATMLPQVPNYLPQGGGIDPFGSLLQGAQVGAQFAAIQQQQAAREQALRQQQQLDEAFAQLQAKPEKTFEDYERVALLLPKDRAEVMFKAFEAQSKERQQATLGFAGRLMGAAQSGNRDMVLSMLRERAAAERNSGRAQDAKGWEDTASIAEMMEPGAIDGFVGSIVSGLPGGKDLIDNITKAREDQRRGKMFGPEFAKATADADRAKAEAVKSGVDATFAPAVAEANLTTAQANAIKAASDAKFADQLNAAGLDEKNWNIRAVRNRISVENARLSLDREKTAADVAEILSRVGERANSIPDAAKKDINEAAVKAATSRQQAVQFNSLADKLAAEGGGFGLFSSAADYLRKATGNQGYVQELRQEFTRLRNSAAVQSLPPGPATDRDIQLVLEGFPPANADARTMASFLRGMAKLQDIDASVQNSRVDWLSQNRGSLGRAQTSFIAGDFAVKPGETFSDFTARVSSEIGRRYQQRGATPAPGAATPTPATPTPAGQPAQPSSIRARADAIIRGEMPPGGR
jgi:hypothetical protein